MPSRSAFFQGPGVPSRLVNLSVYSTLAGVSRRVVRPVKSVVFECAGERRQQLDQVPLG